MTAIVCAFDTREIILAADGLVTSDYSTEPLYDKATKTNRLNDAWAVAAFEHSLLGGIVLAQLLGLKSVSDLHIAEMAEQQNLVNNDLIGSRAVEECSNIIGDLKRVIEHNSRRFVFLMAGMDSLGCSVNVWSIDSAWEPRPYRAIEGEQCLFCIDPGGPALDCRTSGALRDLAIQRVEDSADTYPQWVNKSITIRAMSKRFFLERLPANN